jgi:hypothetical protein
VGVDLGFDDETLGVHVREPPRDRGRDRPDGLGAVLLEARRSFGKSTPGPVLLSPLGREILSLPDDEAIERCVEMDRAVPRARGTKKKPVAATPVGDEHDLALLDEDDDAWKEPVLRRLHGLSPTGFEEFVMYVLRAYGLELRRVGGSGDEGIDGIGLAPITPSCPSASLFRPSDTTLVRLCLAMQSLFSSGTRPPQAQSERSSSRSAVSPNRLGRLRR